MPDNIDISAIVSKAMDSISAVHAVLSKKFSEQEIGAIALCPDLDVQSVFWMAATKKQLESFTKTVKASLKSSKVDFPIDQAYVLALVEPMEWKLSEDKVNTKKLFDGDLGLEAVWLAFRALELGGDAYDAGFASVRSRCLDALAEGLACFRESLSHSDELVLLVHLPDEEPDEQIRGIQMQLNSKAVADSLAVAFKFMDDAYSGEAKR